ncbi:MAG: hypothetical protein ACLFWI_04235 [Coleofasciculus sp.]|uniref:hypothetical protein n=1 Tax=Coleofasciculus sp. TaxID=3100458 RepID=UPI003A1577C3
MGILLQVGAFGQVLYYARFLEQGKRLNFLHQNFDARSSVELFFVFVVSILFCLLFSSWLIYFSRSKIITLGRIYEEFCSKRILLILNYSFATGILDEVTYDDKIFYRLATSDSRYCGRVLRIITNTFIPAITFAVNFLVLLYINFFLTLVVFILIAISLLFLYEVNVKGATNSHLMEQYARKAATEKRQIIARQQLVATPLTAMSIERSFISGEQKQYLDAFEGKLQAVFKSEFVSNVFFAIIISVILVILGIFIFHKKAGWGELIVYLIALRYGLVNLRQVNKQLTSINRFYPQVRRYFHFVEAVKNNFNSHSVDDEYTITANSILISKSYFNYQLKAGNRIGLICSVELNRYTLPFITNCLMRESSKSLNSTVSATWFVTSKYKYIERMPFRELVGLPPEYSWDNLEQDLKETELWNKIQEQLPDNLDKQISIDAWNQIDSELKFSLGLLTALHSNCYWVMIEESGLRSLSEETKQYFLEHLSDKIIAIVFSKNIKNVGAYKENVIAVIHENNLIGLGSIDWFTKNKHKIDGILLASYSQRVKLDNDNFDEYDEDE